MRNLCRTAGFTLLELMIAMMITAMLVVSVLSVFEVSLNAREEVKALSEPMTTGPRILDMIEEDVRGLWTFNIKDNRVFRGENRDSVGDDADRIHLIVGGRSTHQVPLDDDSYRTAPFAEVSYLVKGSTTDSNHLELWRREDPMLDVEWMTGGFYQLLSNRVRSFNVTYYEELGQEAEPFDNWDAAEKGTLPRRIKIELAVERSKDSFNKLTEVDDLGERVDKFERHIVLDPKAVTILNPGVALVPVIPAVHPELQEGLAGGGAAGRGGDKKGAGGGRGEQGSRGNTKTNVGVGRGGKGGRGGNNTIKFPGRGSGAGVNLDRILRGIGAGGNNRSSGGNSGGGRRR